ncbi:MAG: DUF418 domain-containing protein [Cytophagales bacterium]|nr:MAG: DUF418 domain-containing protein [Cytophagales bacterium]
METKIEQEIASPLAKRVEKERIKIIDILRGFALLGIIIVHVVEQYYAGDNSIFAKNTPLDIGISIFLGIFVVGKFFPIFSFLFGLSFSIQIENAAQKGQKYAGRFLWRLAILMAIGFVHQLFYRGDILMIYAALGVALILVHKLPNKVLLIIALALVFNIIGLVGRSVDAIRDTFKEAPKQEQTTQNQAPTKEQQAEMEKYQQENKAYFDMVKAGNWLEIAKTHVVKEIEVKMQFQIGSGRLWLTLGLFILGLYAGRRKFFENMQTSLPLAKRIFKYSGLYIIFALVLVGVIMGIFQGNPPPLPWLMWLGGTIFDFANVALPFLYITGIVMLFQKAKWEKILVWLYPVGRMGLTTYVMQSILGTFIFFGYGLNLLGEVGNGITLLMALGIFGLQILFSKWWLTLFHYGILEWFWRSATYLKWQSFKK